eukprot:CAMPEP_0177688830 /NCGR_PEP_ID=MMETSP0447-20121125/34855_1 /TAXON_ID=0 /ORGANISM="Stygamoeba regulata, Strain BSH-02190019" /LENGTH=526 /DNA_ID=CAMNT_0019199133 /DNA_START=159 /DNA_END=1739 /DNA_ORIENTATION=+
MGYVLIFTVPGCLFCLQAAKLLRAHGAERVVYVDVARFPRMRDKLMALLGGVQSVPQVFFNAEWIGGLECLHALRDSGELAGKIESCLNGDFPDSMEIPAECFAEDAADDDDQVKKELDELDPVWNELRHGSVLRKKKHEFKAHLLVRELQRVGRSHEDAVRIGGRLFAHQLILVVVSPQKSIPAPNLACEIVFKDDNSRFVFWDMKGAACLNGFNYCGEESITAEKLSTQLQDKMLRLKDLFVTEDGHGVDYTAMGKSHEFRDYVMLSCRLQQVSLTSLIGLRMGMLAFFINIYNALMMHGVVVFGAPRNILQRRNFFHKTCYSIGGTILSLDDIEHGVLRANAASGFLRTRRFKPSDVRHRLADAVAPMDARIHFALNCGARSCPPIRVFCTDTLMEDLEGAAQSFCATEVEVQLAARRVVLSKLFYWYGCDFGDNKIAVLRTISRWLRGQASADAAALLEGGKFKLSYRDYDWGNNNATVVRQGNNSEATSGSECTDGVCRPPAARSPSHMQECEGTSCELNK